MTSSADEEKRAAAEGVPVGSDSSDPHDSGVERKLVWKPDLILMPAISV